MNEQQETNHNKTLTQTHTRIDLYMYKDSYLIYYDAFDVWQGFGFFFFLKTKI